MKRIGLYIDVSNLYFCLYNNLKGKLNYAALVEYLQPIGDIVIKKAYGAQVKEEAAGFIKTLHGLDFETYYKAPKYFGAKHVGKADWDVGMAVDIIKDLDSIDMVILATADGDMAPLAEYVIERGKEIVIVGSNISKELQESCTTYIELPSSLVLPIRRRIKHASSNHE